MIRFFLILLISINTVFAFDAKLEIVKQGANKPKIVVSMDTQSSERLILSKIKKSIVDDLNISGNFEVLDLISESIYKSSPNYLTLTNSKIDLYLSITGIKEQNGSYTLMTKLFDINKKLMILEKNYTTPTEDRYIFLAHKTAININNHIKAPSIDWMERYVLFSTYDGANRANIMIGDYTLAYTKKIVSGGLNIFPKWANKKQDTIFYTTYNYKKPTLMKLNIYSGKKEIIMDSDGMVVCSDVNQNEDKILVTAAPEGQADIFLFDLKTKTKRQITSHGEIDVGGQFVDNDTKIAFVSDRLGRPNVFVQEIGKSAVERFVFHSSNNSSVTTYKDKVVFSSRDSENSFSKSFNLYLASTKSNDLKRLTSYGVNQFAKFSSDGESLLFLKTVNNISDLGIIRLNLDKTYLFPLKGKKIQSIDW
ncbi:Tol-Pal system protein TolB [Arcobacter porcinus]|uniref:Translocation protein TolB n=1 Tax=Arcobacter porcinus TaxID=1935204 RepID=A0ABX2YCY5_9BACT|nr:Tol-Pal system protein TolB [Arcobacter porcinus]OCL83637.1 translocation protein TolB [Arcobacter porcinus]OCL83856.1 translocation protein TolB [Arcobacter porcinus]OCL85876.1 translocation protein TolB [Arcobacter porcinus]OCL92849.1 translocation protein TolB [Arcobacter porcinus]